MRSRLSATLLAAALACGLPFGAHAATPPVHDRQPANAPDEAVLLVEIPAGGFTKYESDAEGRIFVDRFLSMPMAYPATTARCPARMPAMAIRSMRWC